MLVVECPKCRQENVARGAIVILSSEADRRSSDEAKKINVRAFVQRRKLPLRCLEPSRLLFAMMSFFVVKSISLVYSLAASALALR
jgi:hypothetical protein